MTNQELADAAQQAIATAIKLMTRAQKTACEAAEEMPALSPVVDGASDALGHLWQAHAAATRAASAMPDVTPKFGGGGK